jgi:hypothetical protein
MDSDALKEDSLMEKVKLAWGKWDGQEDPRKYWVHGWKRVSRILREDKKEKSQSRNKSRVRQELKEVKLRISELDSEEDRRKLLILEDTVRKIDHYNAAAWRKHSRICWLKLGDAPTKYFFAQLKAKHTRETIRALQMVNGQVTKSEVLMKSVIHSFYTNLYAADSEVAGNTHERKDVLQLVDRHISTEDNAKICVLPTDSQVERVVFGFKANKAPGLDGLTADMARTCWEFINPVCCAAVRSFWEDHLLATTELACVIKLLHKGGEKELLSNWRPISLLTLVYKIIAKILANHIKGIIPK